MTILLRTRCPKFFTLKHLRLSAPPSGLPGGPGQWTLAGTVVAGSSPLYCRHQDGSSNGGPPSHHLASIIHLPLTPSPQSLNLSPPPTAPRAALHGSSHGIQHRADPQQGSERPAVSPGRCMFSLLPHRRAPRASPRLFALLPQLTPRLCLGSRKEECRP